MSDDKLKIYAIVINEMVNNQMGFNQEIAFNSYSWGRSAFYNFLNFIKKINFLETKKIKDKYYLFKK